MNKIGFSNGNIYAEDVILNTEDGEVSLDEYIKRRVRELSVEELLEVTNKKIEVREP